MAAELPRRGLAGKVLVSQTAEVEQVAVDAIPSNAELNRAELLKLGVLPEAIETSAMQEESDVSAKRSGAAMYPAFECSRYGRWPDVIR